MAFLSDSINHLLGLYRRILPCDTRSTHIIVGEAHTPLDTLDEQPLAVHQQSSKPTSPFRGSIVGALKEACDATPVVSTGTGSSGSVNLSAPRAFANAALPLEILDTIFLIAVDFHSRAVRRSCRLESDTARHVSQVSRQWRCAALRSVKMWKQALDPDSNSFMWLVTVLKRCDFQPLALVSTPDRSLSLADAAKWILLRHVYPSCQYIHVEIKKGGDARGIRWLLSGPAPHLVDATVVWDSKDRKSGIPPTLTIDFNTLFGNHAPNLRRLHLVNFALDEIYEHVKFPSLESLSLESLPGHRQSPFKLGPASVLRIVQNFDSLTRLNLSCCIEDQLLGGGPDVGAVARIRLPQLQSFTYSGDGAIFMAVNDHLDLPTLCTRHVSVDFSPFYPWCQETTDQLITRCLESIPIMGYESMGVCLQQKRLYISFSDPGQYELSFDFRDHHCDDLPQTDLVRDILANQPGVREYRNIDYFVCAVRTWISYHPTLYQSATTLRFGSTIHGASTLVMLHLLWASPRLECFHLASCETLGNPYLVDALGRPRSDTCDPSHLQRLIIPFCSLIDMHCPSNERDLDDFKNALHNYAPDSLLGVIREIEVAVSPELLSHCGRMIVEVVEGRIRALDSLLSPWTVSWSVMDNALLQRFYYPSPRTMLARDQEYGSSLH